MYVASYIHIHMYCVGIIVITGLLLVLGRKKSLAINTATLAALYGLLYLCAGRYSYVQYVLASKASHLFTVCKMFVTKGLKCEAQLKLENNNYICYYVLHRNGQLAICIHCIANYLLLYVTM